MLNVISSPSAKLSDRTGAWSAIGAILALSTASLALSIHALGRLRDAAIALARDGEPITLKPLVAALGATDYALVVATLAALLWLVVMERRARSVSRMLTAAEPVQMLALLAIAAAWTGQAYLFPGLLLGGDTATHISRFLELRRGFDEGTLAQWTNYQYLGSPLLGFTGPFTYIVGGALDVLVRDPVLTAKIILFTTHVATAWIFFSLLRRLDFAPLPALVASIGFSGSFALLHLFLFRGVFPQSFTILFLVLIFHATEGLMRGAAHVGREWLIFALSTACLIVNHQPHALFVGGYLALFGLTSLVLGRWHTLAGLKWVISAGLLGVVMSAFAVIPITVESDWVMIEPESALFRFEIPTLQRLSQLLMWRDTRTTWGTDYWAYLGIVLVCLAVFGAWSGLSGRLGRERQKLALALLPCFVLSLFLANPVVRNVMFIAFFAGLYAAFGVERVALSGLAGGRWVIYLVAAAVLDVASTSIQPVARTDKQFLIDAGRYLERTAANQRVVLGTVDHDGSFNLSIGPDATAVDYYSTIQRVAGEHNMAATRVHNYAETAVKLAEGDLRRDGRLGADSTELMQLLNVSRIVCTGTFANGCPARFVNAAPEGPLGAVIAIPDASPVLFGRALTVLSPPVGLEKPMFWTETFTPATPRVLAVEDFLHRYLAAAEIDPGRHVAAALPVRALPPAGDTATGLREWNPRVVDYSVGLQRVRVSVFSDGPGYMQLAHPWYPASDISVNGHTVEPLESAIGLVVVPIEPGTTHIEITPILTPIRVATAGITVLTLFGALGFAGWLELRTRRDASRERGEAV